jgi:hypothetical protein
MTSAMRTPHPVGCLPLVIGLLVAIASVTAGSDEQTRLRLFDVTTAHGVVDKRPFRPTQVFAPRDNPIYIWFRGEGCSTGTTIRSLWYYLETDPPLRFTEGEVVVERPDDWGQFNFELAPGKQWPLGEYRIELRVGDVLLAETRFRVQTLDDSASSRDR